MAAASGMSDTGGAVEQPRATRVLRLLYVLGQGAAVAFAILLALAAAALAFGNESVANRLAEEAYYSLVASVVSLLAATLLEERQEEGERSA